MLKGLLGFFAFIATSIVPTGRYALLPSVQLNVRHISTARKRGVNASSTASANSMAQPIKLVIRKTPVLMSSPAQRRQPLVRPS